MQHRILLSGVSGAVSTIIKSIISTNKAGICVNDISEGCSLVILNDHVANDNYSPPTEYNGIPIIMVTGNKKILNNPAAYGLQAAIPSCKGGAEGLEQFKKVLLYNIENISVTAPVYGEAKKPMQTREFKASPILPKKVSDKVELIAIGASTGGTDAIIEVVKKLPATTPPIVIVQHMPEKFTAMYSQRLNSLSVMNVKEAVDGDRLARGQIIVARGSHQMTVEKDSMGYYITSRKGEKVSGHCPSVDVLFSSVARSAGKNAVGVILTGMGRDGAHGLLKMRNAGAYTIGQDEESSVVYGMPAVAFNEGAVITQSPLSGIEGILRKLTM